MEQDDGVGSETDLTADVVLAVVLDVVVALAGGLVEPEAVLAVWPRGRAVGRREAVAVTEVDDDRGTLEGRLDGGPGRVRAVDPDDVRAVLDRLGVGRIGPCPVGSRRAVRGPHDDHDLRVGARGGCGADGRASRQEAAEGGEEGNDEGIDERLGRLAQ
jgi:hypothetical protein